jgi:hypothetical protein
VVALRRLRGLRLFISWEIPLSCVIWRPFGFLIFDCATDLLSSHGLTLTGLLMVNRPI